jgi:hypothetical protein
VIDVGLILYKQVKKKKAFFEALFLQKAGILLAQENQEESN